VFNATSQKILQPYFLIILRYHISHCGLQNGQDFSMQTYSATKS